MVHAPLMDETTEHPMSRVEDLLEHVDLERLGTYASVATTALVLVRRHPWLLVAAGITAAAFGAWYIAQKNKEAEQAGGVDGYLEADNGYDRA